MALDGVFLHLVSDELRQNLIGSRVDKIYQPSREEVVFQMRGSIGTYKMLVSTGAGTARVHITECDIENPKVPPMFCMLLRKHLASGRLIDIRQDGLERILYFDIDSVDEMGDMQRLTVAVEIMGRCSNLILINSSGKIIDSIKRVGEDMSSVRMVLPGMTYTLPPREEKLSLLDFDKKKFIDCFTKFDKLEISKAIMKVFEGISPVFARECAFYATRGIDTVAGEADENVMTRLCFYLSSVSESIAEKTNKYVALKDKDGCFKDFCFTAINQYGNLMYSKEFDSPSALLDYYYSERDLASRMKQKASDLFRFLINTTERISRRTANQRHELEVSADRNKLKECGDLINANIYQLSKGMDKCTLVNFYEEGSPSVDIKLDKRLTPSQNAQKYYSEYRKADIAEKKLTEMISKGEEELAYIESVFDALTRATTENDIAELRSELAEQGYIKRSGIKGKPPKSLPPIEYISSDGYRILVGRNNKQNDKLTLKDASKTDIWCHTHNIPGSHVIIVTNGETPPDRTIEEGCLLSAFNSKGRNGALVPVDYTQVKFVKKPQGAKPGMVIFTNNKTAYVTPDEKTMEMIKKA